MDSIPTVKLLESSGLNENFSEFGTKSDESYPPKVKLPRAFFSLYGAPAVYPNERLGMLLLLFKLRRKLSSGFVKSEKFVGFGPSPSWPKKKSFDVNAVWCWLCVSPGTYSVKAYLRRFDEEASDHCWLAIPNQQYQIHILPYQCSSNYFPSQGGMSLHLPRWTTAVMLGDMVPHD